MLTARRENSRSLRHRSRRPGLDGPQNFAMQESVDNLRNNIDLSEDSCPPKTQKSIDRVQIGGQGLRSSFCNTLGNECTDTVEDVVLPL